eukprot:TRINITY_DN2028_c1_g1_i1.p1 TRINITY_DN2028_c1_g1~~TRINITY_DN2028_c1_g1_i1.p1  ORF type:complete len:548 (-),score=89.85 TRINITY_DN2028_c1_g1_i1:96-1718(-)
MLQTRLQYSSHKFYKVFSRCSIVTNPVKKRFTVRCVSTTSVQKEQSPPPKEVDFETVIGVETHVQLQTKTKAFCSCANTYGADPNTHICPICMGLPGTLPVANEEAVRLSVMAARALNCQIRNRSKFDRKQYFYPDLPKGYQISQYDEPLAENGSVEIWFPTTGETKTIGVTRAHMEEDAGKSSHSGSSNLAGSDYSLIDFNRAGVPLLEIVSEPDMRSGLEAVLYGQELRRIVRYLGVSDGNMTEGSLRCDVNISVRPFGQEEFGVKVELKNMNSFSNVQKAVDFEVERQINLLREGRGDEIVQETRQYNESTGETYSMRKKEGLADYRYFPEPDLPDCVVTEGYIDQVQQSIGELPSQKRERYLSCKIPIEAVATLTEDPQVAAYFDTAVETGGKPQDVAKWVVGDITAYCKENSIGMHKIQFKAEQLSEMLGLMKKGVIGQKVAKTILPDMFEGEATKYGGVQKYVEAKGMGQISDPQKLTEIIDKVLENNPEQLVEFRGGKTKLEAFFVGQVMKESKGRANPAIMNKLLARKLREE